MQIVDRLCRSRQFSLVSGTRLHRRVMVDIDGQFGWMKKHLGLCEVLVWVSVCQRPTKRAQSDH